MDKKIAYLFPGQGAQYSGMAMDLLVSDKVKLLFDTASEIFKTDVKKLLLSDSDTLKRTDVSQPAITTANLAAAVYLEEQGYSPALCAGFSLGEYAALACANVIDIPDCFRLVKSRGEAMQKTIDSLQKKEGNSQGNVPGMLVVVGLSPQHAEELIKQWDDISDLYAANINSPKQIVVSGTARALEQAAIRFKEAGAKRAIGLPVAGPFHSPLMASAVEEFIPVLETISFRDPTVTVLSNVTGKEITSAQEAKKLAALQITSPVRWVDEETAIASFGIDVCFEVGPGNVLQGLWQNMSTNIPVFAAGTTADIASIKNEKTN
ncbi:MAG: ACP S-malonyltransferase [Treponema sp.]|nr:ACP S-malonyltransferase [Treponema sp.]